MPRPTTARPRSASRSGWPAGTRSSGFLREKLGPQIITVHFASQPEIIVDGDTATGTWGFEDTVIATEYQVVITGAAFYEDRYARCEDGRWRIAHTGYVRTYEAMMSLDDLPSFRITSNRWAAPPVQRPARPRRPLT